jgi:hypothetical protein
MTKLNVKRKTKPGQCRAMRCKEPDNGSGFCARHEPEALAQGLIVPITAVGPKHEPTTAKDPVEAAGLVAGFAHVAAEAEIVPAPAVQIEARQSRESIQETLEGLDDLVIASDDDMSYANELLGYVKTQYKALEERRKSVSKPLNDVLKTYNSWFKPVTDLLKSAEQMLKAKIADATAAARKAQDEALARVAEAEAGGEAGGEVLAVAHGRDIVHTPDNVSIREVWDCEIVDPDAVPHAFCDPNVQRLLAYVNAFGAKAEVAGVKFFKKQIVTQRATREVAY